MCFCFEMFSLGLLIGVNIIKVICNCFFFFFCYFSFSFTIWKIICNFYNFRFISINLWCLLDLKYFRCSWYGSDFWYFWLIFIVFEESIRFIDVLKVWVLSWIGVAWCLIWSEWLISSLCGYVIGMLFWDTRIRLWNWVWEVVLGQGSIRYKVCYSLSEDEYKRILRGICFVFFDWVVCVINWEVHRREVSNTSVLKQIGV